MRWPTNRAAQQPNQSQPPRSLTWSRNCSGALGSTRNWPSLTTGHRPQQTSVLCTRIHSALDANTPPVTRPALSQDFAQAYPNLALIYSTVKSAGARQPVPHNINVPAWRKCSHLFKIPHSSRCWNLVSPSGTQPLTHRPRLLATTLRPPSTHQTLLPISTRSWITQPSLDRFSLTHSSGPGPTL